jgi:prolyl-tRNA synthetase
MRFSKAFIPTIKETPAEAEVISHKLLLRAGMIRKVAAGVYAYLPLGWRVMRKIEGIVREEMDRAGALEVNLPALSPAELWQETGRWNVYGKELFRLKDRHDRDFCLGPTHEEVITDLFRREVRSYRQLPINLYQIQTKFRDEIRPRFGLMRGREFSMKDAYSFDLTEEGSEKSYETMREAYRRIFLRTGLAFRMVEADSGAIGGSYSHEFMVMAGSGEAGIVFCRGCHYAANTEKASARFSVYSHEGGEERAPEEIATPGKATVDDVASFLTVPAWRLIKTLLYVNPDGEAAAVVVPGHREANEVKVKNALGWIDLFMAEAATVAKVTGGPVGFSGPVGLPGIPILMDATLQGLDWGVVGANKKDAHLVGVRPGRDFVPTVVGDFLTASEGDGCPLCEKGMGEARGIEVGHIFRLGTKYSEKMGAVVLDEAGKEIPAIMGCYGIGIGRTMAAAIEQNHDADGIVWPLPIAPYQVEVILVNADQPDVAAVAEKIYEELTGSGIEVLYDDRVASPGFKFKDAALIGIPIQVVVGAKGLANGTVEVQLRKDRSKTAVAPDALLTAVREAMAGLTPEV